MTIAKNSLAIAKWCQSHNYPWTGQYIRNETIASDGICRSSAVLIYACDNGAIMDEYDLFSTTISIGDIDVMIWGAQNRRPFFLKMIAKIRQGKEITVFSLHSGTSRNYTESLLKLAEAFGI